MQYSDESNEREQLYQNFKKSLAKPITERFFDESELVDIFDYAGDIEDDYVRLEVLIVAARLYPDSSMLADRHALFYLDQENDGAVNAYMSDNAGASTPIADIVRLELQDSPAGDPAPLEYLMTAYPSFTDEEMIRLVQLAADLNCYDWLIANLPRLRRKTDFVPSLLWEVINEADNAGDTATAIALAEELIELEPFSGTYWSALFRAHARAGNHEEARNAFEYASSIVADEPSEVMWLADSAYNFAPYVCENVEELVAALPVDNVDEFQIVDCRFGLLLKSGNFVKAQEIAKDYARRHPDDERALTHILATEAPDASEFINAFLDAKPDGFSTEFLSTLSNQLFMAGSDSFNVLFKCLQQRQMLPDDMVATWLCDLYVRGEYHFINSLFLNGYLDLNSFVATPMTGASAAYALTASLLRAGLFDLAQLVKKETRSGFGSLMTFAPLPIKMIAANTMALFRLMDEKGNNPSFWADTDNWQPIK